MEQSRFDVIVVGGGHAGCEAASAAARKGATVALVTLARDVIGAMSCNPAVGGVGKGHLVREVDAADGLIARAADAAAIHHRMLNASRGAAVRGPRVQADRRLYRAAIQALLAVHEGLTIIDGEVSALELVGERVTGIGFADGRRLGSSAVVLATGTFLGGRLHLGMASRDGGRAGEAASIPLAAQLRERLPTARLKTGTPPRLDGRTIDWAAVERQPSDDGHWTMSALTRQRQIPQVACGITRTSARTHDIIRRSLDQSPLYAGTIEGRGPRYCPSIEDKVVRFAERESHQIFLEPEGLDDPSIYPNGISTSLPLDVQEELVRSIAGLEQARIVKPGYAVEYDHVDPRVMDVTLGVRGLPGLFLAGQINGTTGYEEAAAQGLVAGANAAAFALDAEPIRFGRRDSYIGVMVDDLVLQGVTEPYRMLTSRAEYRLHLRADNAETRIGALADGSGLLGRERKSHHARRESVRRRASAILDQTLGTEALLGGGLPGEPARTIREWLKRADRCVPVEAHLIASGLPSDVAAEIVADEIYAPFLERQARENARALQEEDQRLSPDLDYGSIGGLSREMVERLEAARPRTLGEASRVRGVTPAAVTALLLRSRSRAA